MHVCSIKSEYDPDEKRDGLLGGSPPRPRLGHQSVPEQSVLDWIQVWERGQ